ncbi:MAG TPA: molybdate ABC transporter substrate-binding protein [Pseudomonadales bacterium]
MKFLSFALAVLVIGATPLRADVVRVAVASNFTPVLESLAPLFEQTSGHTLSIISGATGNHYAQIRNGAPFDVFLAADDERPRLLEEEGRAIAGSRFTYALGRLALWSADARRVDSDGAVLQRGEFARLALANPKLAPYGVAAQEVLTALGLWQHLQRRIVLGDNIAQTLQFVQTGNAELGFIALSQLADVDNAGSYWEVPPALYSPIVQQGVLLKDSAQARAFIDFIASEAIRERIRAAGYGLP